MAFLPMAVYGLEVPAGDLAVSARPDIPASFRITMAAVDPTAESEGAPGEPQRATLKIIRLPLDDDAYDMDDSDSDSDSDAESFDTDEMEAMLAEEEDDSEDDEDEEEANGGPSDPAKSKAARTAAAKAEIKKLLQSEGMDVDGLANGINGVKSAKAKGKMPVTDLDEDDDDDDDEDDDEDEDDSDDDPAEIEEFTLCTLDTDKVKSNIVTHFSCADPICRTTSRLLILPSEKMRRCGSRSLARIRSS